MHPHQYQTMTNRMTRSPDTGAESGEAVVEKIIPDAEPTLSAALEPKPEAEAKPEGEEDKPEVKEQGEEAKPPINEKGEGEDQKPVVPEAYVLKAPDGAELDPAAVTLATPVFKELNLTNEQAQKVTDLYAGQILPAVAQQVQGQTLELLGLQDIGQWTAQTKADPEIGGAKLEENLAMAAKARDQFSTPELRTLLETSRLGNHPEWVRLMAKVGRAISEGSFETTNPGGKEETYLHQTLYGEEYQPK